jgi:hypothetical protein
MELVGKGFVQHYLKEAALKKQMRKREDGTDATTTIMKSQAPASANKRRLTLRTGN